MNIIEVLLEECRTSMRACTFEINSVLATPTEKGSLDRLSKAIYDYSRHESAFQNLLKLKNQIDEANSRQTEQGPEEEDEN